MGTALLVPAFVRRTLYGAPPGGAGYAIIQAHAGLLRTSRKLFGRSFLPLGLAILPTGSGFEAIDVTANGLDYNPVGATYTCSPPPHGGQQATFALDFGVYGVTVGGGGGANYTGATTVTFAAPPAGGIRATGHPVIAGGVITSIVIDNPGLGYTTIPACTIADSGGGAGATGTSRMGIARVRVTDPGAGYVNAAAGFILSAGGGAGATFAPQVGGWPTNPLPRPGA